MKRAGLFRLLLILLATAALMKGGYIHAKAALAQTLLQAAWSKSIATGQAQKPWPWADTRVAARLEVPARNIDLIVLEGGSGEAMAFGPALLDSETLPTDGPRLLGGHRDTHLQFVADLAPDQTIAYTTLAGETRHYHLAKTLIADSRKEKLQVDPGMDALILMTCYPFDALLAGGPLRYVAIAEPIETAATSQQSIRSVE